VLRVLADPARLVQCLANVLTNAAKYTDPGGEIRVEARSETAAAGGEAQAVLTVSDNGAGIAADLLPHVFDLFVQSDRTLDRAHGGLGVGLSVVKRLVEMHGGQVAARSGGVREGTTIDIRLPLCDGADDAAPPPRPAGPRPQRILVVDDKEDAADSLAMILKMDGHDVTPVYSAHDALERAATLRPDVALLDIGLPEMDGYELAARLRAQPELARMRLIALTGYGQAEDQQRARAAGFDFHLVKPADLRALQQALDGEVPKPWIRTD
jgi:CheY-like chemotaxis protein